MSQASKVLKQIAEQSGSKDCMKLQASLMKDAEVIEALAEKYHKESKSMKDLKEMSADEESVCEVCEKVAGCMDEAVSTINKLRETYDKKA